MNRELVGRKGGGRFFGVGKWPLFRFGRLGGSKSCCVFRGSSMVVKEEVTPRKLMVTLPWYKGINREKVQWERPQHPLDLTCPVYRTEHKTQHVWFTALGDMLRMSG